MKRYEVTAVGKFKLKAHDPDETGDYKKTDQGKDKAKADTEKLIARLTGLQERLYANATRSLLIVLQGMDTSGKDGTIRHVMSGVNPQGCKVVTFKAPSKDELAHDFLWRVHREVPPNGHIGIFNRSHTKMCSSRGCMDGCRMPTSSGASIRSRSSKSCCTKTAR